MHKWVANSPILMLQSQSIAAWHITACEPSFGSTHSQIIVHGFTTVVTNVAEAHHSVVAPRLFKYMGHFKMPWRAYRQLCCIAITPEDHCPTEKLILGLVK